MKISIENHFHDLNRETDRINYHRFIEMWNITLDEVDDSETLFEICDNLQLSWEWVNISLTNTYDYAEDDQYWKLY